MIDGFMTWWNRYEDSIDQMFANANPGLASRYNKRRVVFKPWSAEQAVQVVVAEIEKDGKSMTEDARLLLRDYCREMQPLPSWGSARDVFETILPGLYSKRASRLRREAKMKTIAGGKEESKTSTASKASKRKQAQGTSTAMPPYEAEDVQEGIGPVLRSRMQASGYEGYEPATAAPAPDADAGTPSENAGGGRSAPKTSVKRKEKIKIHNEDSEVDGISDDDIYAALEQACVKLGYSEDDIVEMLGPDGDYTDELLKEIVQITGCSDEARIRRVLDGQKDELLTRMELVIEQRKKAQSAEEAKIQEKLKKIGRCPMDFEWLKVEGGWRCAGGSHFCTDDQVNKFEG